MQNEKNSDGEGNSNVDPNVIDRLNYTNAKLMSNILVL